MDFTSLFRKTPEEADQALSDSGMMPQAFDPNMGGSTPGSPVMSQMTSPNIEDQVQQTIRDNQSRMPSESLSPARMEGRIQEAVANELPAETSGTPSTEPETSSKISRLLAMLKPEQTNLSIPAGAINVGSDVELKAAQADRDKQIKHNQIMANINTIGSAIGHQTADNSQYEQGIKLANNKVTDLSARIENQKNDPKSQYSAGAREFAKKFGITVPESMSGAVMEKNMPYLLKAYDSDQDNKARVISMVERENERKETSKDKNAEKKTKDINDFVTKQSGTLVKSKAYEGFVKVKDVESQIKNALANPSGVKDISALYGVVKLLDPDSAVRPGEIELSREAIGLWGNIKTKMSKIGKNPRVVDTKFLQEVNNYMELLKEQKVKTLEKQQSVIEKQLKQRGAEPKEYMSAINPLFSEIDEQRTKESMAPAGGEKDPDAQKYLEMHSKEFPGLTYEQALSIIKKRRGQ